MKTQYSNCHLLSTSAFTLTIWTQTLDPEDGQCGNGMTAPFILSSRFRLHCMTLPGTLPQVTDQTRGQQKTCLLEVGQTCCQWLPPTAAQVGFLLGTFLCPLRCSPPIRGHSVTQVLGSRTLNEFSLSFNCLSQPACYCWGLFSSSGREYSGSIQNDPNPTTFWDDINGINKISHRSMQTKYAYK